MSLASWYTHQYSTWNRTRRLQQSQYLARTDTNTSRQARTMAQTDTAGDLGNIHGLGVVGPLQKDSSKEKKGPDSLFGPNIGVISGGPAWTVSSEKKVLKDELTMDVVKSWIEKSKEPSQPTTTLQALVNLKRPTLRLSPLVSSEGDDSHFHQHGLEFEYDCDAPKCGIYVHVLLPPGHPDIPPSAPSPTGTPSTTPSKLLVFESVVEGGFGKVLKLEEGAVLELGRFDMSQASAENSTPVASASNSDPAVLSVNNSETTTTTVATSSRHGRRRLTHFFTKRHGHNNMSVSGPALAVVDASSDGNTAQADASPASGNGNDTSKKDAADEGVKITIRLVALDEQGTELSSPNEQVTYLCVERFGAKAKPSTISTSASAAAVNTDASPGGSENKSEDQETPGKTETEEEDDSRPWVVKVVKREATIGPHTFHLHEIYGLTSSTSSSHTHAPTAPLPSNHTYPPTPGGTSQNQPETNDDDSPSECLLCLSSPREVVLLPCRHLVACKDCALNMVEFGAGGNITHPPEEPSTTTTDGAAGEAGGEEGTGAAAPAASPAPVITPTNPRRKRKAKGWFCPVCRQPYTSLLRITTTPPPLPADKNEAAASNSMQDDSEDDERDATDDADASGSPTEGLPLPVTAEGGHGGNANTMDAVSQQQNATEATSGSGGGVFSRPGFLRGLTGRSNAGTGDLESQL